MGGAVAVSACAAGARVLWASEGRSDESRGRATRSGLHDVGTIAALVGQTGVVLSVCPPHAAVDVARAVAAHRFSGIYVDANAISPDTARVIGGIVEGGGASFVDAGIVGPPPQRRGTTRLYLSGPEAPRVAALFAGGALEAIVLDGPPGAASALKMAYAAWTKGTTALLMAVHALAVSARVDDALVREWERSLPDLPARSAAAARGSAPEPWRFVGEREAIATTFAPASRPGCPTLRVCVRGWGHRPLPSTFSSPGCPPRPSSPSWRCRSPKVSASTPSSRSSSR